MMNQGRAIGKKGGSPAALDGLQELAGPPRCGGDGLELTRLTPWAENGMTEGDRVAMRMARGRSWPR